ncbi:MAG: DNA polymerase III subunit delta, partial [bacterium]
MGRTLQRYKKLFDGIKSGKPRGFYFLYGPEEFLKKEFISELIDAYLPSENRAFNLDIFHGDDFDRDGFDDRISSFPLFTSRRVVVVKRFDALTTPNKDFVIERAQGLPDSVVLVVETPADKLDSARLKNIKKRADDKGLSFHFQHLSEDETIERVKARLQREGFTIDPEALDLLVESVGTHLIDLANEIDKIILSSDQGDRITRDTVAAVVGRYRTENLFALLDRLGKADEADVVHRLNRVIDGGDEPVFVLAMVIRRVIQLLHVCMLREEHGGRAGRPGGMSSYQAALLVEQAKYFQRDELEIYLRNLRWADMKIKTSAA